MRVTFCCCDTFRNKLKRIFGSQSILEVGGKFIKFNEDSKAIYRD